MTSSLPHPFLHSLFLKPTSLTQVRIHPSQPGMFSAGFLPFPHLSTFFPSAPLTPQSHAQHLKSWHRAVHVRGHCHNFTIQMTELEALAKPCLSLLMRLNQTCNSLGPFPHSSLSLLESLPPFHSFPSQVAAPEMLRAGLMRPQLSPFV